MLVQTILNSVTDYKSFVFKNVHLHKIEDVPQHIDVEIVPRKNSQPVCPKCGKSCPIYDTHFIPRRFDFVPLWNIPVVFLYKMRRCSCKDHEKW